MPNKGAALPLELIASGDLVAAGSRLAVVVPSSMNESASTSLKYKGMEPESEAAGRAVSKGRAVANRMPSHNAQDIGANDLCVQYLAQERATRRF
jgi:hypothetical protein